MIRTAAGGGRVTGGATAIQNAADAAKPIPPKAATAAPVTATPATATAAAAAAPATAALHPDSHPASILITPCRLAGTDFRLLDLTCERVIEPHA